MTNKYEIFSVDELRRLLDCVNARYAELIARWEPRIGTPEMRRPISPAGELCQTMRMTYEIREALAAKGKK